MKALAAVVLACLIAGIAAIAVMLRGPAWAWWINPLALASLAGTVLACVAIMAPRHWWH